MKKRNAKGSDIPPDLRVTHGKKIAELPAVPCLVIVVGPPIPIEPGEQPQDLQQPCNCAVCRYRTKHTGHA